MKQLKLILFISFVIISAMPTQMMSDSLWAPGGTSLYTPGQRQINVGDIITVQISESTTAAQEASTRTSKESGIGTNILSLWDRIATLIGNDTDRRQFDFELSGEERYRGLGQTSRRSQVRAVITATVTEVLESGNVFILGEHHVKVNNEVQTIRISGIVRPQDISPRNTVFSYQLAKADVSIIGAGVVNQKQSPGLLTRVFGWLF
jgi:flagellar L-ring protein precursor FlgH